MERIDYRELIEKILQQHAAEQNPQYAKNVQVVFDCAHATRSDPGQLFIIIRGMEWRGKNSWLPDSY